MAKRNWISPYRTAFISNLWSMLASLPIGFLLSWMGSMIEKLTSSDPSLRSQLTFDLAQVFYFGQLRGPDFGFVVSGTNSGIGLAALVFIGICWSVTVGVEGRYYQHINPKISRRQAIRAAVFFNVVTYCVLLVMWLPYSYYEVKSEEEFYKKVCSSSSSDSMHCDYIFNKYPEIRRQHFKDTLRSK